MHFDDGFINLKETMNERATPQNALIDNTSALLLAVEKDNLADATKAVYSGADVSHEDNLAIKMAFSSKNIEMIDLLQGGGADLKILNKMKSSDLEFKDKFNDRFAYLGATITLKRENTSSQIKKTR